MQVDPLKPSQICKNSLGTFYVNLKLNPNHIGQNYSVIVFGGGKYERIDKETFRRYFSILCLLLQNAYLRSFGHKI